MIQQVKWNNRPGELFIENCSVEAGCTDRQKGTNSDESVISGFRVIKSKKSGRACSTIVTGHVWKSDSNMRSACVKLLSEILSEHIKKSGFNEDGCILFAGIGNACLASDSIGPKCASKIIPTMLDKKLTDSGVIRIAVITPGIPARTGIDTSAQIKVIADHIGANLIITADSVAAGSEKWLQSVIQVTDCGITPGSASSHISGDVTAESMERPVISIGVPMVIRTDLICDSSSETPAEPMLVTRAEADAISDCFSGIIAGAVNLAVLGKYGL